MIGLRPPILVDRRRYVRASRLVSRARTVSRARAGRMGGTGPSGRPVWTWRLVGCRGSRSATGRRVGWLVGAWSQVPIDAVVGESAGQPVAVGDGVVPAAQQGGVVQVGGAAVDPVDQVVSIAPRGRRSAAGER